MIVTLEVRINEVRPQWSATRDAPACDHELNFISLHPVSQLTRMTTFVKPKQLL